MKFRLIAAIEMVCLFGSQMLLAQLDINHYTRYNTLDGLNHNHITSITQDSIGFIWIGTENGPLRFDGTSFVTLTTLNAAFSQFEPYTVKLSTLGKTEIGISTIYGAHALNINDYSFKTLTFTADEDLSTWAYNTYDVSQDRRGYYGVSTKTGFYVFEPDGKLFQSKQVFYSEDIGTSWILYGRNIVVTPDGQMLQKNGLGINVFDDEQKKILENPLMYQLDTALMTHDAEIHFTFIDSTALIYYSTLKKKIFLHDLVGKKVSEYPIPADISNNLNWFSKIVVRNDSTLLINGKTGLYQLHYNATRKSVVLNPQLQWPDIEITYLYVDRDHRLWVGTNAGLYKENISLPVERFPISLPGKPGLLHVKWMEKRNGVWYASAAQDGLLKLDGTDYHILQQKVFQEKTEKLRLGKMIWRDDHRLWIATSEGVLAYDITTGKNEMLTFKNHPDYLQDLAVHEIYQDLAGMIWVAGNESNAVYRIDTATNDITRIEYSAQNPKFKVTTVYRFTDDGHGNIWFCGDVMARYNVKEQRIDSLVDKLPLQQNTRKVFLLYRNSLNEYWIATNGENWHIYNDQQGFSVLDDPKLSPDLNKYQRMIDDHLYYISRQGKIIVLDTRNKKSRILSAQDGWDQETIGSFGFFKDPDNGYMVFGGDNMIYRFKPQPVTLQKVRAPFIAEINVLGKRQIHHPDQKLIFNPDEHTLQIKFLTLNYNDPANQIYAYRLKESNSTEWITLDQPVIILNQIPSGHYDLELQVTSKNNDWLPVYNSYPLTIRFPFYRQWWFILFALATAATVLWLIIRYRLKQMRFISNLDRQVIEYELKALHAQMNPHFVFNCLNSIKEMIMSKDNRNANIYLNKFSYLLRSTLDQSKLSFVPLSHTIEYLGNYLEMEKLRFTHFNYTIDVQEGLETEGIVMAPLLLQPIVENAIWHGQGREKENNELHIRFYACEDDLICEVEDFGAGISATKLAPDNGHVSSALDNIRKRIELLNRKHDLHYQLVIVDKLVTGQGQGTLVKLMFKHKHYEFD